MPRVTPSGLLWALLGLAGCGLLAHGLYVPAKATLAQHLLADAWGRVQAGDANARPWPWADTSPVGELSVGGDTLLVLRGATGEAMAFAPGLMEGVDQPIISAHRDTHFKVLATAEIGDTLRWTTTDDSQTYQITEMRVVDTPNARVDPDALILTTCWPLDGLTRGSQRLIVTAHPVS